MRSASYDRGQPGWNLEALRACLVGGLALEYRIAGMVPLVVKPYTELDWGHTHDR